MSYYLTNHMWLFSTKQQVISLNLLFCNVLFSYQKPISYLFSN